MSKVMTSIAIDEDTKEKSEELFAELGLDFSTAINLFLRQSIRENGIPFAIQKEEPNPDTIAAIREVEDMEAHPEKYKKYDSFKDLLQEVMADA